MRAGERVASMILAKVVVIGLGNVWVDVLRDRDREQRLGDEFGQRIVFVVYFVVMVQMLM